MSDIAQIINDLGRDELCKRLDLKSPSFSNAVAAGQFPPGWYAVVTARAREVGISVPLDKFAWRQPTEKVE